MISKYYAGTHSRTHALTHVCPSPALSQSLTKLRVWLNILTLVLGVSSLVRTYEVPHGEYGASQRQMGCSRHSARSQ